MWRDVIITRNHVAEDKLFKHLGLDSGEKYNLINEYFHGKHSTLTINTNNSYKNVYMSMLKGYSLFDWIRTMQNAQSIHTFHTSLQYLMDLFNMPEDLHIYKRPNDELQESYDYLFNKHYIYHQ